MVRSSVVLCLLVSAWVMPATGQVFVIGGGLAEDCYRSAESDSAPLRETEETCTRALREQSLERKNRAATYVNRGIVRMRAGKYDSAIDDYDRALRIRPALGQALVNRGAAHIYREDYAAARLDLDQAIELGTEKLFAAYYNRAIAREQSDDIEGAYYDFKRALELRPDWDLARRQLSRFEVR